MTAAADTDNDNAGRTTTTAKFRMVAFDLDGTLLGPDHQVSAYAVRYLRALHDKGFLISIATGRSAAATAGVIRRLNLPFPAPQPSPPRPAGFPVVCTNGAKGLYVAYAPFPEDGRDATTNPMVDGRMRLTELFHRPVPLELARKTLAVARDLGCVTNYYVGHDIHAQLAAAWHRDATEKYARLTGVTFAYCADDYAAALARGPPSKLLVLCRPEDVDATHRALEGALGAEATVIRGSPPFFVEVLRPGVCKGDGLELLCEALGVGLEECIAFGDGDNDLEFVEMAGLGVAMRNGRDNLKAVADAVTRETNAEDGAIRFLQRLEAEGRLQFTKP